MRERRAPAFPVVILTCMASAASFALPACGSNGPLTPRPDVGVETDADPDAVTDVVPSEDNDANADAGLVRDSASDYELPEGDQLLCQNACASSGLIACAPPRPNCVQDCYTSLTRQMCRAEKRAQLQCQVAGGLDIYVCGVGGGLPMLKPGVCTTEIANSFACRNDAGS